MERDGGFKSQKTEIELISKKAFGKIKEKLFEKRN